MQTVEKLDLIEFKDIMSLKELEVAKIENAKPEKKTWYSLQRTRFLKYIYYVSTSPLSHFYTSILYCFSRSLTFSMWSNVTTSAC
jgi:hypothetical protein